ncbi:MAG: HU family DNA-binding protein [bacterium]|nr:HU family DNA-binding protein [bacterium]
MKQIKTDFIRDLKKTGLPETDARKVFDLFLDTIINSLSEQKQVNIKNFGVFKIVRKKKTSFVNPRTKKISSVTRPRKVRFKASRNLIKFINP